MNTTITTLIVDDESPAREIIKHYLADFSQIEIIGEATNGFEAVKIIKEKKPLLLFLDIQMPKLTGFELLELIEDIPEIIFSTAYDQFAIRAFELNAVDYLLKPYSKERFNVALQKAIERIHAGSKTTENIQTLQQTIHENPHTQLTRVAVKDRQQIHVIPIQDIIYMEAYGDYVKIHTETGTFLKEKTMKYFEENLPSKEFVRIHRSSIVNVNEIAKIQLYDKENYVVYLKKGSTILKASSNGYKLLKAAVNL